MAASGKENKGGKPRNGVRRPPSGGGKPVSGPQAGKKRPPAKKSGAPSKSAPDRALSADKQGAARISRGAPQKPPANAAGHRPSPKNEPKPGAVSKQPAKKPAPQNRPPRSKKQLKNTRRAYNKAVRNRSVKGRKGGSRGGNYIFYYILGIIVIAVVMIILSNTVLFRCATIEVVGNITYTEEQVIAPSGLETGMNLLHIDDKKAKDRIYAALPYIDMAEVQKVFPTKIRIVVTEAEKWYCLSDKGVTAVVSRRGRIVDLGEVGGLPVVRGYEPVELLPGKTLSSEDEWKTDIPKQFFESAEKNGIRGILGVDITDRFDIIITLKNDVILQIGGIADIDSKLTAAAKLLSDGKANITVNASNPEKLYSYDNDKHESLPELPPIPEKHETGEAGTSEGAL